VIVKPAESPERKKMTDSRLEVTNEKAPSGQSLLLMKSESFNNIMSYLTKSFGTPGLSMIYSMGHDSGEKEVKQIREEMKKIEKPLPKKDLVEKALQRMSQMGWGRFDLQELDQITGHVEVKIKNNPFSDSCAMNETCGCLFLHGYLSGIMTESLEAEIACANPRCIDLDDSRCVIRLMREQK
jgi:predicted hydrocarbon binding protein